MTILDRVLNYTIVIILAVASILLWEKVAELVRAEPLSYHGVTVERYEVQSGETVTIHFKLHRTVTCPAIINRFWITRDGKAIVRLEPVFGGYTQPTNGIIDVPVELKIPTTDINGQLIPHGIEIGYSGYITSMCPDSTKTVSFPTAWFMLK
jgi:hypothetical protein